jgi:hypothetical protein
MTAFWVIALCSLVEVHRRFGCAYCLHHSLDNADSMQVWNVGLLQRDYTVLYTRKLSSSYSLRENIKSQKCCSCWSGETGPLTCDHQRVYCSSRRWYMSTAPRWNDNDRGKPKNSEKTLSQCHFICHQSHMDWPRKRIMLKGVWNAYGIVGGRFECKNHLKDLRKSRWEC